ncbi:hypothetical protein [Labedella endophytica]|uniref:Phosphodiesterase n=1 Tax=Labedella endophytica TaxID=1523160 RepID=A0A3S0WWH4_9MICO|nr:hypothetical protein [Labedella endophytica]RUQ99105.1 hypothetical protein ELQ94_12385 [Labedella endophytica]
MARRGGSGRGGIGAGGIGGAARAPLGVAGRLAAVGGGVVLGGIVALIRLARAPRPIHPAGLVLDGRIEPLDAPGFERSGIDWIDGTPSGPVEARLSRGIGVPVPVPDIWGLAFRQRSERAATEGGAGVATRSGDVLLASLLGSGRRARFVPMVRLSPWGAVFGTVMPYRSATGAVLVGARTISGAPASATPTGQARELGRRPWVLELLWATPSGPWRPFATLSLSAPAGEAVDRADLRFDPVLAPPSGARTYEWTRALREPAYRRARGRRPLRRTT